MRNVPEQYARFVRRKVFLGVLLLALNLIALLLSLQTGAYPIGVRDMAAAFFGRADQTTLHVLWNIRLPQAVAALLAGACLGPAGAAMQNVLRNPLASPFTLGISQGAIFGVMLAIAVPGVGAVPLAASARLPFWHLHAVAGCAFGGAMVTVAALVFLSSTRNLSPAALILAGVAISAFFGSATMLLQYFASDTEIAAAVFWTFGDLKKAQWPQLGVIALALIPTAAWFLLKGWHFNAMAMGEDSAQSLGINARTLRVTSLVFAALAASITTAFMGIIGFVGLVAPHVVRMFIGDDHRYLFPYSALAAGFFLLIADVLARTIMAPIVLPVGILTSFVGAPLFLFLLLRCREIRS